MIIRLVPPVIKIERNILDILPLVMYDIHNNLGGNIIRYAKLFAGLD